MVSFWRRPWESPDDAQFRAPDNLISRRWSRPWPNVPNRVVDNQILMVLSLLPSGCVLPLRALPLSFSLFFLFSWPTCAILNTSMITT